MGHDFQADIDAVDRIAAIPTMLDVVCRTTGMRFAAIARVTADRWITCKALDKIEFGLKPSDELPIETTLCSEVWRARKAIVIDDVAEDPKYCHHHTPATYGFRSYISVPIILKDGSFFGTLCAIDPQPARLKNPETIGMFKLFAELVASHLDADKELSTAQAELRDERHTAELREQFIAVLGHDLRNPIASIDAGARMLLKTPLDGKATEIVGLIQGSVVRMREMIGNILDFARTRLGDGLTLDLGGGAALTSALTQVILETRQHHPAREIEMHLDLTEEVVCDPPRIAQLFSNLLSNAVTHGQPEAPVRIEARTAAGEFILSVANAGAPIPDTAQQQLFKPFFRREIRSRQEGLGLGLYIAAEIAAAHGGTLEVASTDQETRFTLRMPTHR